MGCRRLQKVNENIGDSEFFASQNAREQMLWQSGMTG